MKKSEAILIVCPIGSAVDGAFVFNESLVRELSQTQDVTVLTCGAPIGDFGSAKVVTIPVLVNPRPKLVEELRSIAEKSIRTGEVIGLLGRESEFDFIVGHDWSSTREALAIRDQYFPSATAVGIFHTVPRRRFELWENPSQGAAMTRVQHECIGRLDLAVGVGPLVTSWIAGLARNELGHLTCEIHEFIPGFSVQAEAGVDQDAEEFTLLALGRFEDPLKGLSCAIDSVATARDAVGRVSLRVRGFPGELVSHVQADIETTMGAGDFVRALPSTHSRPQVEEDIRASQAGLVPSLFEEFSLVALEFLERGKPVLVTRDSGFADFVSSWVGSPAGPSRDSVAACVVQDRGFHRSDYPDWQHARPEGSREAVWSSEVVRLMRDYPRRVELVGDMQRFLSQFTWRDSTKVLMKRMGSVKEGSDGEKFDLFSISHQNPHQSLAMD